MKDEARHALTALLRLCLFAADVAIIVIALVLVIVPLNVMTGMPVPWLIAPVMAGPLNGKFLWLGLAAIFVANRVRSRRFDESRALVLDPGAFGAPPLARLALAAMLLGAVATVFRVSPEAALGWLAGHLVAFGAGASLRGRMTGTVSARRQLPVAFMAALALHAASWLASWARFRIGDLPVEGGLWAPALGVIAGFFEVEAKGARARGKA